MEKVNHTPGNWSLTWCADDKGDKLVIDANINNRVAELRLSKRFMGKPTDPFKDLQQEANAKLIAAAPDLLESILFFLDRHDLENGGVISPPTKKEMEMFKNAIKKATK